VRGDGLWECWKIRAWHPDCVVAFRGGVSSLFQGFSLYDEIYPIVSIMGPIQSETEQRMRGSCRNLTYARDELLLHNVARPTRNGNTLRRCDAAKQ